MVKQFYRYEVVRYASFSDDEYYGQFSLPSTTKLTMTPFGAVRETPKGYWIASYYDGDKNNYIGKTRWVSKTAKKRYAYPTKKEALTNLVMRSKRREKILEAHLSDTRSAIYLGENELNRLTETIEKNV